MLKRLELSSTKCREEDDKLEEWRSEERKNPNEIHLLNEHCGDLHCRLLYCRRNSAFFPKIPRIVLAIGRIVPTVNISETILAYLPSSIATSSVVSFKYGLHALRDKI